MSGSRGIIARNFHVIFFFRVAFHSIHGFGRGTIGCSDCYRPEMVLSPVPIPIHLSIWFASCTQVYSDRKSPELTPLSGPSPQRSDGSSLQIPNSSGLVCLSFPAHFMPGSGVFCSLQQKLCFTRLKVSCIEVARNDPLISYHFP